YRPSIRRAIRSVRGPSLRGWALLLGVIVLAAGLRLYQLGVWPPGPYRDEAYNGLDALGVLRGGHALFFPANNGREPSYIYLVAISFALLGPTVFALRLPAAVIGALATLPAYLPARDWFGRATGLFAATLWAITFWPVHLGRIGLRAGLLPPLLALTFWLGTRAWRETQNDRRATGLWLAAGAVYGLSFYTYLAVRFTPLILALFAVYLVLTGRRERLWSGGRILWFALGAGLVVAPLGIIMLAEPSLIFGRAGQVSILSPTINGGNPLDALLGSTARAVGMYIWRGDDILRHNAWLSYGTPVPAGRPVFDWLMVVPFLVGLVWCLRHWRRPPAALLLIWQLVMLGPTILAEDAPHFLRAVGVLPGALFFPAIGLGLLWSWPRLPVALRRTAVVLLLAGSAALTMRDYADYAQQPDVGYLFESAAAELAYSAAADATSGAAVYLDRRFPDGWPSVRFLLDGHRYTPFSPDEGLPPLVGPASVVYAWPYDSLEFLAAVHPPARVEVAPGPLARGDLEPEPYSLYTRYAIMPGPATNEPVAIFGETFLLHQATTEATAPDTLMVAMDWESAAAGPVPTQFIHILGPEGMLAQYDGPPGRGLWPPDRWQAGIVVGEHHELHLNRPFNPATDSIEIGLYWAETGERLPVLDARGNPAGDAVIVSPAP
ncbi:MAG TPA: glycosyltransferase family 39 protein, partial [Promineifilum sp.]|nr:glycosyltransferase family 39 protein [Promineifilum sp.]